MAHDLSALLAPGGHAREFMRAAPNGGDWVDGFCEAILSSIGGPGAAVTPSELSAEDAGAVESLLNNPKMGCTSLNLSKMPDGKYRITMLRIRSSIWLTGYGDTFSEAVSALHQEVELNT